MPFRVRRRRRRSRLSRTLDDGWLLPGLGVPHLGPPTRLARLQAREVGALDDGEDLVRPGERTEEPVHHRRLRAVALEHRQLGVAPGGVVRVRVTGPWGI